MYGVYPGKDLLLEARFHSVAVKNRPCRCATKQKNNDGWIEILQCECTGFDKKMIRAHCGPLSHEGSPR